MAEIDTTQDELTTALNQATTETRQLETVLTRLLKVLTENGFQVSVDLVGLARGIHQHLDHATRNVTMVNGQLDQFEQLLDMFAMITSSLELEQVLGEVMDTVIRLTGAERAYLMLRDRQTGELSISVARNWDRESLSESDAVFSRSVVETALANGKPFLTTNAQADDRLQDKLSVVSKNLRSILCIPLLFRGQVVGILYADNRVTQDVFRQELVPMLTAFGTQAAIAIENARNYGQVKEDLNQALIQLQSLQIEIDRNKVASQVSQITESDYFQKLAVSAREMRRRVDKGENDTDE
jgi:transcriptional regulator with GAF, ATPase, and Fis domain